MNRLLAILPLCAALTGCGKGAAPAIPDALTLQELDAILARTPGVQQAVESARSDILARAYLQQVAQAQPRPNADEVRKYYAEHPELFAQRRVFSLEEIEVMREAARQAGFSAALRDNAAQGASMEQIADWLRARDVQHAVTRGVRAAEQIPLDLLPRLQAMKEGEVQVIDTGGGDALLVVRVLAAKPA